MNLPLPSCVTLIEPVSGYPVYEIVHTAVRARVAKHGAHLMEWQPAAQKPVLYLSPQAVLREGKAIRGGIPICWPWFNAHPERKDLPSHGVARTRFWELENATANDAGVALTFSLRDDEATRALCPLAFHLQLSLKIGASLELVLRTENKSGETWRLTQALHSYFAVGDADRCRVEGLDGALYLDTVGPPTERRQAGAVKFSGEVDRLYAASGMVRLIDEEGQRAILIEGGGSGTTVVWNPGKDKAAALADLPDDDYRHFVCVETANAWRDFVEVPPGGSHEISARLSVAPL